MDKIWRDKHKGIVTARPSSNRIEGSHCDLMNRSRIAWLGSHKHCASLKVAEHLFLDCLVNPYTQIGLFPTPRGGFKLADAQAIKVSRSYLVPSNSTPTKSVNDFFNKTILGLHRKFPKPVEPYRVLDFYGSNIITTEFHEWKRHRKIVAPAFSEVRGYPGNGVLTCVTNDDP